MDDRSVSPLISTQNRFQDSARLYLKCCIPSEKLERLLIKIGNIFHRWLFYTESCKNLTTDCLFTDIQTNPFTEETKLMINKFHFEDVYSKIEDWEKALKSVPTIQSSWRNAIWLQLPKVFDIRLVGSLSQITPFLVQPRDIETLMSERWTIILSFKGDKLVMERIVEKTEIGRGYQVPILINSKPLHDAVLQHSRDGVNKDGTVTEVWLCHFLK